MSERNEYDFIVYTGDPILRHKAAEIPLERINSSEIVELIKNMKKVLRSYNMVISI